MSEVESDVSSNFASEYNASEYNGRDSLDARRPSSPFFCDHEDPIFQPGDKQKLSPIQELEDQSPRSEDNNLNERSDIDRIERGEQLQMDDVSEDGFDFKEIIKSRGMIQRVNVPTTTSRSNSALSKSKGNVFNVQFHPRPRTQNQGMDFRRVPLDLRQTPIDRIRRMQGKSQSVGKTRAKGIKVSPRPHSQIGRFTYKDPESVSEQVQIGEKSSRLGKGSHGFRSTEKVKNLGLNQIYPTPDVLNPSKVKKVSNDISLAQNQRLINDLSAYKSFTTQKTKFHQEIELPTLGITLVVGNTNQGYNLKPRN